MEEIWKDVVGYEGYYKVSSLGRIQTVERIVNAPLGRVSRVVSPIIRKQQLSRGGYRQLTLSDADGQRTETVHRLVAAAFLPTQEGKEQVNHIDGNKDNNAVSNLEWCNAYENTVHAFELGLRQGRGFRMDASREYNYEETREHILSMVNSGMTQRKVSEVLGIHRDTVSNYVNGKRRTTLGHV